MKKMKNKFGTLLLICVCVFMLLNILFISAVALYFFEKDSHHGEFSSLADTIRHVSLEFFTVGYSDITPVSFGGKLICIGVPILGNLLGVLIFIGIVVWIFRSVSSYRRI